MRVNYGMNGKNSFLGKMGKCGFLCRGRNTGSKGIRGWILIESMHGWIRSEQEE